MLVTLPFEPSEYLHDPAAQVELVAASVMSGNADSIAAALRVVAQARGIPQIALKAGMPAAALERELGEGNPTLSTILCVLRALDLRLNVCPLDADFLQVDYA